MSLVLWAALNAAFVLVGSVIVAFIEVCAATRRPWWEAPWWWAPLQLTHLQLLPVSFPRSDCRVTLWCPC